ncbi:MAG: hypothetical protein C5B50_08835 [Verrucomicrobia bacterium]|nr:MAG: hypothetical protein C5B50_08835 [Verrucomicrobiota bacterium]
MALDSKSALKGLRSAQAYLPFAFRVFRVFRGFSTLLLLTTFPTAAQTNFSATATAATQTSQTHLTLNSNALPAVRAEQLRAVCLQNRRCVAGRVVKIFPNGIVVESGYPSLLRDSLHGAWHLPGTVTAGRATNLVEKLEPDSLCIGTVFLTDLPRLRGTKIQQYDYVVLHSYPAGEYTYTSVGGIQHTVRRFAGGLETAVKLLMQTEQTNATASSAHDSLVR